MKAIVLLLTIVCPMSALGDGLPNVRVEFGIDEDVLAHFYYEEQGEVVTVVDLVTTLLREHLRNNFGFVQYDGDGAADYTIIFSLRNRFAGDGRVAIDGIVMGAVLTDTGGPISVAEEVWVIREEADLQEDFGEPNRFVDAIAGVLKRHRQAQVLVDEVLSSIVLAGPIERLSEEPVRNLWVRRSDRDMIVAFAPEELGLDPGRSRLSLGFEMELANDRKVVWTKYPSSRTDVNEADTFRGGTLSVIDFNAEGIDPDGFIEQAFEESDIPVRMAAAFMARFHPQMEALVFAGALARRAGSAAPVDVQVTTDIEEDLTEGDAEAARARIDGMQCTGDEQEMCKGYVAGVKAWIYVVESGYRDGVERQAELARAVDVLEASREHLPVDALDDANRDLAAVHDELANYYAQAGEPEKSVQESQRAFELAPTEPYYIERLLDGRLDLKEFSAVLMLSDTARRLGYDALALSSYEAVITSDASAEIVEQANREWLQIGAEDGWLDAESLHLLPKSSLPTELTPDDVARFLKSPFDKSSLLWSEPSLRPLRERILSKLGDEAQWNNDNSAALDYYKAAVFGASEIETADNRASLHVATRLLSLYARDPILISSAEEIASAVSHVGGFTMDGAATDELRRFEAAAGVADFVHRINSPAVYDDWTTSEWRRLLEFRSEHPSVEERMRPDDWHKWTYLGRKRPIVYEDMLNRQSDSEILKIIEEFGAPNDDAWVPQSVELPEEALEYYTVPDKIAEWLDASHGVYPPEARDVLIDYTLNNKKQFQIFSEAINPAMIKLWGGEATAQEAMDQAVRDAEAPMQGSWIEY